MSFMASTGHSMLPTRMALILFSTLLWRLVGRRVTLPIQISMALIKKVSENINSLFKVVGEKVRLLLILRQPNGAQTSLW